MWVAATAAPWWRDAVARRLKAGLLPPALQGTPPGYGLSGKLFAQLQLDQASAPAWMVTLQGAGSGLQAAGKGALRWPTVDIAGLQSSITVCAIALPERTHGAIPQLQLVRDDAQGLTRLMALDDVLADRVRDSTGHDAPPRSLY